VGDAPVGTPHDRYPCFDGIRALAALMIIVYHAVFFATWFDTPGGTILWNLNAGVWVFFSTSGFLLYLPLARAHVDGIARVEWRGYSLRRAARIYPAYWAVLAFFTFVVPRAVVYGFDGFLLHTTLTQTYVHEPNPFLIGLPPAWSLVVELSFYVFLPFYALAIGLLARNRRALATELAGVAVLVALGVAAIIAVAVGFNPQWMIVLPQHIAAFALGMLLAVLATHPLPGGVAARLARAAGAAWAWWAAAFGLFLAIPLVLRIEPFEPMSTAQAIGRDVLLTVLGACVVVPAALGAQDRGAIRRTLRTRPLVFLGLISYGLYLWHWFVLGIVQGEWLDWPLQQGNWPVVLAVGFPVIVAAAATSWFVLERPVLRAAHAMTRRRPLRVQ
jgi:peptidoglycan/LPS O-acetylase OafA/YrhL